MAQISTRALAQLFRRAGMAYRAGVGAVRIWASEGQRGSATHRGYMQRVKDQVASGESVADALRACDGYFPPMACEMVEIGEHTGRLDATLLRLAEHYDHVLALRRTFLIGIAWPAIQLFAAVLVIGLVILLVGVLAPAGGEPVDILGFGLVGVRGFVIYLLLVATVAAGFTLSVVALMRGWLGTAPLQLAMQVPVLGGCLRTMALERLTWSLAMSLEAGMDARRSMRLALRSTQNPLYLAQMRPVDEALLQGQEFHESLRATRVFPDEFLDSLEAAEISGTQTESLERLSAEYQERARTVARMLTVVSTFLIWGLVALIIITMIVRLFMFYLGTIDAALKGI